MQRVRPIWNAVHTPGNITTHLSPRAFPTTSGEPILPLRHCRSDSAVARTHLSMRCIHPSEPHSIATRQAIHSSLGDVKTCIRVVDCKDVNGPAAVGKGPAGAALESHPASMRH